MLDDGPGRVLALVSMLLRVASMQRIRRMENSCESKEESETVGRSGPYDGGRCNEFWSGDVTLGFLFRVRRPVG